MSAIRCQMIKRDEGGPRGLEYGVRGLKSDQLPQLVFMRVADDLAHAGENCDFFRRSLCVAAGDHDPGFGVLAMDAPDGGTCVLVGRGGHGAGVKNYKLCLRRFVSTFEAALPQLAFDGSTVGLRGPAAEVHHVKSCHVSILTQDQRRMDASTFEAGARNGARAAGT